MNRYNDYHHFMTDFHTFKYERFPPFCDRFPHNTKGEGYIVDDNRGGSGMG